MKLYVKLIKAFAPKITCHNVTSQRNGNYHNCDQIVIALPIVRRV